MSQNGYTNGVNGHAEEADLQLYQRFSDIPGAIDIPVKGEDGDEAVNLDLTELLDDIDELCDLLANENAARNYWITIALAYAKQKKVNLAIDILKRGLESLSRGSSRDKLTILTCLVWIYLWKCRHAPRIAPSQQGDDDRVKDQFLHLATTTLNEASRLDPSYEGHHLARGVLYVLRASIQGAKDRADSLQSGLRSFDSMLRATQGKNIMAILGKAKCQYSLGRFPEALKSYQDALEHAPDMLDPDPRVGIGCCLWQLGHKEAAQTAWERSLELNPNSSIANILLGLHYLDQSSQYSTSDPDFAPLYKKGMTVYTQNAFKLDDMQALTCSTFGGYFLLRKIYPNVEKLAKRAVERTDVNAIASDGWYLRARRAHYEGELAAAADCYNKSDQARGGAEKGYLPAKFGAAQIKILQQDFETAKHMLDKIIAQSKSLEAMTLSGLLSAETVFANQATGNKEDTSNERRKAIALLENVKNSWKDTRRKVSPDSAVLLNLAKLYEADAPERSLACLQQVEQMELDEIPDEDRPDDIEDEEEERKAIREQLSPQLLNNIGCFHFQSDRYSQAREDFQAALNACVKMGVKDKSIDTDALVTTISYNLARTYEAEGIDEEAQKVYSGLLERHPDYMDANTRLAYIALNTDAEKGANAIKQLVESDPSNLEVRSLYGWYINRNKKRTHNINEDQEQRHYKQTLQTYDKHDLYSLTGMGNLHLAHAREMPRATDQDKERRSKMYMRAVEFFDKVLSLDQKNAYAAQGMGIALVEDRKDNNSAIQIFSKIRESIRDFSVHLNLGHLFAEVKQFSRSIENYEQALNKMKTTDPQRASVMACLGRVWLLRGRQDKMESKLEAYKTSLEYSQRAYEAVAKDAKDRINYKFNVAFVQIQIAQMINQLPESQKTSTDVEIAGTGLDDAIASFLEIADDPHPPFPKGDIQARANMGRNTMRKQLAGAMEKQTEYERKNASRLESARKQREDEIQRRETEKRKAEEQAAAQRAKIAEERQRMMEEDRLLIQRRMEEDKAKEEAEYTTDAETGERKKREKKPKEKRQKRKKKGEDTDTELDGVDGTDAEGRKSRARSARTSTEPATGSDGEAPRRKKKRKLERKGTAKPSKYKSSEFVQESDDEEEATAPAERDADADDAADAEAKADDSMADGSDEEDAEDSVARSSQRKRGGRAVVDEDDDDELEEERMQTSMVDETVAAAGSEDAGGP